MARRHTLRSLSRHAPAPSPERIDAYRRARYRMTAATGGMLPRANCPPADTPMPNSERNAVVPSIAQGFCTLRWHPFLPF
ncbi:hypothetical protein EVG18_21610 [Burkholderia pyrrocinia]|nr:hypothetical protein EVG18_21610 [Burkholderia pyrrocinia]